MELSDIKALIDHLSESSIEQFEWEQNGVKLKLVKSSAVLFDMTRSDEKLN